MNWPMFERVERQAQRLHEMMEYLQVDPARLARQGDAYAEARTRCLFCTTSDECRRWLDGPRQCARPEFCPNLPLFEACVRNEYQQSP
jgi:hypothetical protein